MGRLRRHGWWGLLIISVMLVLFGLTDIASGGAADVGIPEGLTGRTIADLERESPDAYGVFDFATRLNGWSLITLGTLLSAIVLIPFRAGSDGPGGRRGSFRSGRPGYRSSTWSPASTRTSRHLHQWSQDRSSRCCVNPSCWSAPRASSGPSTDAGWLAPNSITSDTRAPTIPSRSTSSDTAMRSGLSSRSTQISSLGVNVQPM